MKTTKQIRRLDLIFLWVWVPLVVCTFGHRVWANEDTDVITFYVDDDAPNDPGPHDPNVSDPQEDGSSEHPYDDLYEAVFETRGAYSAIVVAPGFYQMDRTQGYYRIFGGTESRGRTPNWIVSLTSTDPNDFSVVERTVLDYPIDILSNDFTTVLAGFTIQGKWFSGIDAHYSDRVIIRNCIIRGNQICDGAVLSNFAGLLQNCLIADNQSTQECGQRDTLYNFYGTMENCTIVGNSGGVHVHRRPSRVSGTTALVQVQIRNSIVYGNEGSSLSVNPALTGNDVQIGIDNCNIQDGLAGMGYYGIESEGECLIRDGLLQWGDHNLDQDPLFVRPGAWEVFKIDGNDYLRYLAGDYHLRSRGWRWTDHAVHDSHWLYDTQTSPCIDAGDPASDWRLEPVTVPPDPEGIYGVNRGINLGVYGGTAQASLGPSTEDPVEPDTVSPIWPISPVQP